MRTSCDPYPRSGQLHDRHRLESIRRRHSTALRYELHNKSNYFHWPNLELFLQHTQNMYLIDTTSLKLHSFLGRLPPYVILSHTWGDDEITFDSMQTPDTLNKDSKGYQKIKECCRQAKEDGYAWAWVATCCIDKRSSAELSEAINSMYRYYWKAEKCYAYLSDISVKDQPNKGRSNEYTCTTTERSQVPPEASIKFRNLPETSPVPKSPYGKSSQTLRHIDRPLTGSRWFTRGWTLQELLAPAVVEFYDKYWRFFGTRSRLAAEIQQITDIDMRYLHDRTSIKAASLGLRLSWASKRQTTRDEDIAYCLLGIVGVNMPLLYGEGKRAFRRLQVELLKQTRDHTIFAWSDPEYLAERPLTQDSQVFLAPSPAYFRSLFLADVRPTFLQAVESSVLEMTALGLHITLPCIPGVSPDYIIAALDCSKKDNTRIGIRLALLKDGRYRRFDYGDCPEVSPEKIKEAVTKRLYILDDNEVEETSYMEKSWCTLKVDSLKMEGISVSEVLGYSVYAYKPLRTNALQREQQLRRDVRAFCGMTVKVSSGQIICFIIRLRFVNITIFSSDFGGRSWLRVVLSDNELTPEETTGLLEEWAVGMQSEHLGDYATASRGAELQVDVHARRKQLGREGYTYPCWQLAIHIRAGSAMSSH